jgi:hypothetical protein
MVQVQFAAREFFSAILTGVPVPGKNIVTAEADAALRDPVVGDEQNDSRDLDHPAHQADGLIVSLKADLAPAIIVKGLILGIHGLGEAGVKQAEGPPDGRNMHGQKRLIEH